MLTASNEGMPGSDEGQRKKEANRPRARIASLGGGVGPIPLTPL